MRKREGWISNQAIQASHSCFQQQLAQSFSQHSSSAGFLAHQPVTPSAKLTEPPCPQGPSLSAPLLSPCSWPGWAGRGRGAQGASNGHSVLVQWKDLKLRDKDTAVKDDVAEPPGFTASRPQVCDREQLNFIITLSPMVFFIGFFTTGTKGSGLILAEWRTSLAGLTAP